MVVVRSCCCSKHISDLIRYCAARKFHKSLLHKNISFVSSHAANVQPAEKTSYPRRISDTLQHSMLAAATPMPNSMIIEERTAENPYFNIASSLASLSRTSNSIQGRVRQTYVAVINGTSLTFEGAGIGKQAVLLMPGALGSSTTDFNYQLQGINYELFQMTAWNPRGYGLSQESSRDWSTKFFQRDAEDALKLMEFLRIERYSILGWSDGGITAMIMAGMYPERVKKLVLWGANAYVTKEEIDMYETIRDIKNWSIHMRKPYFEVYGEAKFQQLWSEWIDIIKKIFQENKGDICKKVLRKIRCPTLIIHGDKDPIVPRFHPDYLKKHITNSRFLLFPEGKHNLHMKYYKEFNSVVESFILEPSI